MKNAIIVGASGMVGSIVLRECLASDQIAQVTSITRKKSGINHPKLVEIIHNNFLDYSSMAEQFKNHAAAYFCIGVYTGQVADAEFKKITVDFTKVFADALKKNSPNATFCLLSGAGADQKEKSRIAFAKYKGMAENYLISKDFEQLYILRPGYIYPVEKREEPNIAYRIYRRLYPLMNRLLPSAAITSERLGKAMFHAGISGAHKAVLENEDIKEIG